MTDDRRVRDQRKAQRHEQETADRALRELFAGRPCPGLPPFFEYRCAACAELQRSARPLGARERLIMRAYWVLTLVIAGVVLARTGWPIEVSPVVAAGALLSIATTLLPVLFFASLRGGLFALMRRVVG
jgi:CHASE2 domain-containing sensor protein